MFGQDLDAMYEARCAQDWEDQNAEVEICWEDVDEDFGSAIESIRATKESLEEASVLTDGLPVKSRIMSLIMDLGSIMSDVETIRANLKKEVKTA